MRLRGVICHRKGEGKVEEVTFVIIFAVDVINVSGIAIKK